MRAAAWPAAAAAAASLPRAAALLREEGQDGERAADAVQAVDGNLCVSNGARGHVCADSEPVHVDVGLLGEGGAEAKHVFRDTVALEEGGLHILKAPNASCIIVIK